MENFSLQIPAFEEETDVQNYTLDLLSKCFAGGLISDKKLMEIRSGLNKEFTETAEQYTRRESSSLSKKRAELLYSSVLYRSDVYLLSLRSVSKAVDSLNTLPIDMILKEGQKLILSIHDENQHIFNEAEKYKLNVPCHEYNMAMGKAFDDYFKHYSARFDARNCCNSIDYPLLNIPAYGIKSQGVMFIHDYYTGLMLENKFCRLFDEGEIIHLLECYGRNYGCDYTELLFNISEVLLNNLFVSAVLEKPFGFKLTENDISEFENMCGMLSEESVYKMVSDAFKPYHAYINDTDVYNYLEKHISVFTDDIAVRLKNKSGLKRYLTVCCN